LCRGAAEDTIEPVNIDVLLYQGCDELDVIGPYETLATAAATRARFDVRLVTLTPITSITCAHGADIRPHATMQRPPDLLIVPGGGWIDRAAAGARTEVVRGELPRAIAAHHAAGATVASVCTGAMLLAAAGLLDGRRATTHHDAIEDLRGTGTRVIDNARVVDDGDIITAAGVTSGIDLALWIIERELGVTAADATARSLEYESTGGIGHTHPA